MPLTSSRPTLLHLVQRAAAEEPDRELLVEISGSARTYAEFDEETRRWADVLRELGVERGEHVAVMLPTSIAAYAVWLGVSWLHATEVPINTAYRSRILSYVLNNCGARTVVIAERYLSRIVDITDELESAVNLVVVPDGTGGSGSPTELLSRFRVIWAEELLDRRRPPVDLEPPHTHELCCVMYTSGTTGPSKGVRMPWGALRALADHAFPDAADDGATLYTSFPTFHLSGKMFLYMAVQARGRLVVREVFDTHAFWDDIRRYDVTRTSLIGAMPNFILKQPEREDDSDTPLREVNVVPLPANYKEFARRFGVRICTAFAMTEAAMPLHAGWDPPNHRTCGRVVPGYEVRVVDDLDEDVGPGVQGELIIRSDRPWELNLGYLGMDEATVKSWRNGWFHTGDAFVYDEEGWFYFIDRTKDAIRRRGENISSFEVEAEVLAHDDVAEVAAVAVPSDHGEDEIKIWVTCKPGRTLTPEVLLDFLIPRMARFMVPRYIEFVDELPKTPTAKVRKVELRERGLTADTFDRERAGIVVPK
ncbi:MAG: AMP-binding protein [Mycolicibacterium sp.]